MNDQEYLLMSVRLRDVRDQRGLSRVELSARTGLHENTIRSVEQGKHPSLDTLVSLVQTLDVSMDYIVLGIRPQTNNWGLILRSDDELNAVIAAEALTPKPSDNTAP